MFYLSGSRSLSSEGETPSENGSSSHAPPRPSGAMSQYGNTAPALEDLENTLEQSGLLLTKKNVARDENFIIEVQEVCNVGYLPLHSLLALPVCWAAARILPAPNRPRNMELFSEDDSLDIALVLAFPKAAQNMRTPAIIDVHRCSRMTLPPKSPKGQAEDALLVFSWSCDQDLSITMEKSGPDKYKPTTL
ncbi:uncharacterized protein [Diadema antillarum]|uniref:uncharacterized protein n=1 Tax=Diadema antillarum TaxID=105358 RepID=UPI003A88AA35